MKSHDICNAVVFASLTAAVCVVYSNTHSLNALWIWALMFVFISTDKETKTNE